MRLENENEHHDTGWTPPPMAHEFSNPEVEPAAEELPIPEAAPTEANESGYGWEVHETPHFGNEAAPEAEPYVVTPTDDPTLWPHDEPEPIVRVQSEDFPVTTGEPLAVPLLSEADIEAMVNVVDEAPPMDEAARKKMLGEKIPTEWVNAYGVEASQRLRILSKKIEKFPDAPVNFVLRGELYLSVNEYEKAAADFQQALTLAEQLDPELDWGYINAAYIDRAHIGLSQIT